MLIVDDEQSVCDFLRSFFELRFEVRTAGDAPAALHLMLEEPFDVLLIDKNLPGMSGVELIRQIRELNDDVAVAMITGYASASSIVDTLNLGIDAYIEKPFRSLSEFSAQIDAIVTRKKTPKQEPLRDPSRMPVVVASIGDSRERIGIVDCLAPLRTSVVFAKNEADLLSRLTPEPDAVILDTDAWPDWTPKIIEQIAERAPFAACIVLTSGNLSNDALKQLVDLCVLSVLMWKVDPDWHQKLVDSIRRVLPAP